MANPHGGAADSYYNSGAAPPSNGYQMQRGPAYRPQYQKQPPNYNQNFETGGGAPSQEAGVGAGRPLLAAK